MSELKPGLEQRYRSVRVNLGVFEKQANRAQNSVLLLPVSKTFPIAALEEGVRCGMRCFGENYVQEAVEKIQFFKKHYPDTEITWHLIGPLQSNKTRLVAENFDWVQTIDRLKIATRLSEQRPSAMRPLNVLIEVNISGQDSKSGVEPADVPALAQAISTLPNLKLRGLMAIPAPADSAEEKMRPLLAMRTLFDEVAQMGFDIDTLSMGMSSDMQEAVQAGSTMVRVGSAIFGPRDYSN